MGGNILNQFVI